MFDPSQTPRVFGMEPGIDFAAALVDGILARNADKPPHAMARIEIYVNTSRMQRRIRQLFAEHGALLLPRVKLVTDLARDPQFDIPAAIDGLGRRLELAQLVRALIDKEPDLAPKDSAFDLADSLATLLEEMQGEHVGIAQIDNLDVAEHSAHWARSQKFISLVHRYLDAGAALDVEGRQRAVVEALAQLWKTTPPDHPIIVAGSTGSRGTTRAFMRAVAHLPQGALILPGFDHVMPAPIWPTLCDEDTEAEDHPQYRYYNLMQELDLSPTDIHAWGPHLPADQAHRNAMVSLALRPAPVTDAWLEEGPKLQRLAPATAALTLVEAPTPRIETLTIALRLRKAIADGTKAALITPDQTLARQVSAALEAWQVVPNDSAGSRLDLSPPGRLLRQTAQILGQPIAPDRLLALLKHPLICGADRRAHLRRTRQLEMDKLRGGPPALTRDHTQLWAENLDAEDPGTLQWHDWLWSCLEQLSAQETASLQDLVTLHQDVTARLTQDPGAGETQLWLRAAGEKAQELVQNLLSASDIAGDYRSAEYRDLLDAVLRREEVREPYFTHPDIMIWGTLEARVQGADLVILAGLNDGTWPAAPDPDAWLNRDMRRKAGLRLPEGRIGLSAHDFQQAIAAKEVMLTRSVRNAEAETVPSRWLNRIENLMTGLGGEGKAAFKAMQNRGREYIRQAQSYDTPRLGLAKAPRPAPQPPVAARPKELHVTGIETLIRDPYAIYAEHVLGLRPLKPLHAAADAALRGTVIHKVLQAYIGEHKTRLPSNAEDALMRTATRVFEREVAWPATRAFWMAKLARAVSWFVETEKDRRLTATPDALEADGKRALTALNFTLKGRADRIDADDLGGLVIYDYKSGSLPTKDQQDHFNKQLPLLATLTYEGFPYAPVRQVGYIGLGASPEQRTQRLDAVEIDEFWQNFEELITKYMDPDKGYTARRAVHENRWDQDYDTLARYGEWDFTDTPVKIRVGP